MSSALSQGLDRMVVGQSSLHWALWFAAAWEDFTGPSSRFCFASRTDPRYLSCFNISALQRRSPIWEKLTYIVVHVPAPTWQLQAMLTVGNPTFLISISMYSAGWIRWTSCASAHASACPPGSCYALRWLSTCTCAILWSASESWHIEKDPRKGAIYKHLCI